MKYTVNVHLETTVQVEVNADDEDQAELLGIDEIQALLDSDKPNSLAQLLVDLNIIDAEVVSNTFNILDLDILNNKLKIKGD